MTRGKRTCKILKEIRQQIADNNEIEYITSECHFQGECKGTCPKCESEVRYLENELNKRRQLGKVVTVAGISLGIAGSFSACNPPKQETVLETPAEIQQDTMYELGEAPIDSLECMIYSPPNVIDFVGFSDVEMEGLISTKIIDTSAIDTPSIKLDDITPLQGKILPNDIFTDTLKKENHE